MKFFNKKEVVIITVIFLFLIAMTQLGFMKSKQNARDEQRVSDVDSIAAALQIYKNDYDTYPPATSDGRLLICEPQELIDVPENESVKAIGKYQYLINNAAPCDWGVDEFSDITESADPIFMEVLPTDPYSEKGRKYMYISDGSNFQVFAALEGDVTDELSVNIPLRELGCGGEICNYGRGSGAIPLEKSLK